jgi:hypothetical protein
MPLRSGIISKIIIIIIEYVCNYVYIFVQVFDSTFSADRRNKEAFLHKHGNGRIARGVCMYKHIVLYIQLFTFIYIYINLLM